MIEIEHSRLDSWEKAKALTAIIATVVIPLTIAFSSSWYGTQQKEKELQLKYIELSIQILSAPPSPSNQETRMWALDIINKYSEVKISKKAREELLKEQLDSAIEVIEQTTELLNKIVN